MTSPNCRAASNWLPKSPKISRPAEDSHPPEEPRPPSLASRKSITAVNHVQRLACSPSPVRTWRWQEHRAGRPSCLALLRRYAAAGKHSAGQQGLEWLEQSCPARRTQAAPRGCGEAATLKTASASTATKHRWKPGVPGRARRTVLLQEPADEDLRPASCRKQERRVPATAGAEASAHSAQVHRAVLVGPSESSAFLLSAIQRLRYWLEKTSPDTGLYSH